MSAIRGTYINGMIVPDSVPNWAEGARVSMTLQESSDFPADDDSPEAITRRVALMDEFERAPVMTDVEAEEFERLLKEQRAVEVGMWQKWTQGIGKLFS